MTRVLLVQVPPEIEAALLSRSGQGAETSFERIDEAGVLTAVIDSGAKAPPDVVVLGGATREPLRIAQRAHALESDPPVLILSDTDHLPALERALRFTPFIGENVVCLPVSEGSAVVDAVIDMLRQVSLRHEFQSTVEALNARLAVTAPPPRRIQVDRLLDRAPLAVIALDNEGAIISWNPRAALYFEVDELAALGHSVFEILTGPGALRLRAVIDECFAGREPNVEIVGRLARRGRCEYIEVTATPITGGYGNPGALLMLQDVTARVETERDLEQARTELLAREQAARAAVERERDQIRELDAQKDEFLSSVAHDLRTPLTSIQGWSQMLGRLGERGQLEPQRVRDVAGRIEEGVGRMTRMIDQLLDVANLQLGRPMTLRLSPVNLTEMLQALVIAHKPAAPEHEFVVESAGDDLTGMWDRVRLERMFGNLLSNAIKFSPQGGTITIRTESSGEWAEVHVIDQGIGIPSEDLPHVFERFRRGTNATGKIYGTGIGLATAREIAAQHGGDIVARSEVGRGATFVVRLPFEPGPSGE